MKQFILKVFAFIATTILMFFLFWMLICSTREEVMRLPNNEQIVFFGNSHIETSINDTIVKNSFNIGQGGASPEQIYSKLKLIHRYNPQVDTIVLGFDNVLYNKKYTELLPTQLYSPYFYDTYDLSDIYQIITNSNLNYIQSYLTHPFNWFKLVDILPSFTREDNNITMTDKFGKYLYLERDKLEFAIKKLKQTNKQTKEYDKLALYFLDKTIKYCNDNELTLIFMCPPQHKKCPLDSVYYKLVYQEKYSNIPFYDFRTLQLPDSCFGDLSHLNYKGAKVFSEYFEKEVLHKQNYK